MLHCDQDDLVAEVLNDMYKKDVFGEKFLDDVIEDSSAKPAVDPRTKMALRHKQVLVYCSGGFFK